MVIAHDEAKQIALRLIAGSFRRDGERLEPDRRPRFSIPCRPGHDDDCLILTYIEQQQKPRAGSADAGGEAWRPIATAPHDRELLLCNDDGEMTVGCHIDAFPFAAAGLDPADRRDGLEWVATVCSPYADFLPALQPTWWRPRPRPPRALTARPNRHTLSGRRLAERNPHKL